MTCSTKCNGQKKALPYVATFESPAGEPTVSGHVDLTDDSNWKKSGAARPIEVKTRGGNERYLFDQIQAEVTHMFDFPYRAIPKSVHPSWRIKFRGRTFNITAVYDVDEMRRTMRFHCTEVV